MTKQHSNNIKGITIGLILGIGLTFIAFKFLNSAESTQSAESADSKEPLYWVAPMDPNYKRDQPGQSPMGMDLIPVYEEQGGLADSGPGTIQISPAVVNNLGVRTKTVKKQDIHTQINTVGYVQYDEDLLVHIHPRVDGWVEKLYIKTAGNPVTKGQALYELYSPELVNAQEEYLLALDRKNQRLIHAAENRLQSLQITNEQINQLKKSRQVKQKITFYAPQSGVVDNLNIREGYFVKPGTTMMSIGSLEQVWVEAEVFERQADLLAIGQPVTMTLEFLPGKQWTGEVDYIYPTLNPETRTLKVRLKFDNEDQKLKPNMFAQITIHSNPMKDVLVVPTEAVIRTGDSNRVVLALGDGQFKSIDVELGRFYNQHAEILSGLQAGDQVVTSAQFLIDSESSKTSDFKRMEDVEDMPESVWVAATIQSVMPGHRMINASHEPIEEWDWPEMTMDFTVAENVDMSGLKAGTQAHLEIKRVSEQSYQVTGIHIQSDKEAGSSMDHSQHDMSDESVDNSTEDNSTEDHSGHDMSEMDHSQHDMSEEAEDNTTMDHSTMDHSGHDMSSMDHSQHEMSEKSAEQAPIDHSGHDMSSMNHNDDADSGDNHD
ncbi:MAG: efflux RND transporter periplasmic adaptor subunit [Marinicella pacifica]